MLIEADAGSTQVKRLATNIYRAAGRMRELLADLSNVARGDRPTAEICNIGEVIAAASDAASATTNNHNVEILLRVSDGIELPLIRSHMERVFFNLIANAVEAMPAGGQLHVVCRKANRYVLIEFEDTGPGIPRGIRDRLFEPFVTAGKQDGLGLGLALSRQIVLNHGGDIWSEPATGARFVVRLPLNRTKSSIDNSKVLYVLAESSTLNPSRLENAVHKKCAKSLRSQCLTNYLPILTMKIDGGPAIRFLKESLNDGAGGGYSTIGQITSFENLPNARAR
jgi:K+-sensing histidine kinase KdpD